MYMRFKSVICVFDHLTIEKVQPGYGVARARLLWFLLNAERPPVLIEFNHAVAPGIADGIGKYQCAVGQLSCGS
jgi:hypothetical protein